MMVNLMGYDVLQPCFSEMVTGNHRKLCWNPRSARSQCLEVSNPLKNIVQTVGIAIPNSWSILDNPIENGLCFMVTVIVIYIYTYIYIYAPKTKGVNYPSKGGDEMGLKITSYFELPLTNEQRFEWSEFGLIYPHVLTVFLHVMSVQMYMYI